VSNDESPEAARIAVRLLLEFLEGREMTIADAEAETGRSYQVARRYLAAIDEVVGLETAWLDRSTKVWRLPPQSVPVHPDKYVKYTGQLPLFGEPEGENGE